MCGAHKHGLQLLSCMAHMPLGSAFADAKGIGDLLVLPTIYCVEVEHLPCYGGQPVHHVLKLLGFHHLLCSVHVHGVQIFGKVDVRMTIGSIRCATVSLVGQYGIDHDPTAPRLERGIGVARMELVQDLQERGVHHGSALQVIVLVATGDRKQNFAQKLVQFELGSAIPADAPFQERMVCPEHAISFFAGRESLFRCGSRPSDDPTGSYKVQRAERPSERITRKMRQWLGGAASMVVDERKNPDVEQKLGDPRFAP